MLSIELIRKDPEYVRQALARRGEDSSIDEVLSLDSRRRQLIYDADTLKARRNEVSRGIGRTGERDPTVFEEMRWVGDQISSLEGDVKALEQEITSLLLTLPNIPADDVPEGADESSNVIVRTWGDQRNFDFTPLAHWDLGEHLGLIDFQRGVKLSGSRFFVLTGLGARLERSLINWMLDLHTGEHGYTEVSPPLLVRREVMEGSGNLPKFRDNLYRDEEDDLWLIPTAEVPLTSFHREEILPPGTLPLNYVSFTPCFRRERAAAGRDTRGIKRVHQFSKVELYKLVEPEHSEEELQKLITDAEDVCQRLGLPYRVLQLCTGELGFASSKSYDLEMWAPGCGEWLEVSSCSNCTDFQARRASIRYRSKQKTGPVYPYTLNGSGLALPRVIIALIENYQQRDGSVDLPEVLRPYMGRDLIPAR